MPKPSNYDQLYVGRFMKAGQFLGKKPTLTITDIDLEELEGSDGKKQNKVILSFKETKMQLVACKTNGICIKAMFGKELKNWVDKQITLFPGQFNGEECIRVWGSPEIEKDMTVAVELPRRKAFNMTMHVVKANGKKAPVEETSPDPRILTSWELLGWNKEEGATDRASKGLNDSKYLAHLSTLLDEVNTNELAGEFVP